MEQERIWDAIAQKWAVFKTKAFDDTKEFLEDKTGKILDLGCGSGRNFSIINGEIYGVDFSQNMLDIAQEKYRKANLTKANLTSLPFEDAFFDCAICAAVVHCIPEKEERTKALKELYRVLKPNTKAFITVWSKNNDRVKNKPKEAQIPWTVDDKKYNRYYYIFDKEEFSELVKSVGFKIISIKEDDNIVVIVKKP